MPTSATLGGSHGPEGNLDRSILGHGVVPIDGASLRVRGLVVASAIAYIALVHWSYSTVVAPLYTYYGESYNPAPDGSLELALLLCAVPSLWLPIAVSRPSQVILWMLYLLGYVPSILVPLYVLGTGFDGVYPFTLMIAVSFVLLSLMQWLPRGEMPSAPVKSVRAFDASARAFENSVLLLAFGLGAYIALAFGVSLDIPDPSSVYDVRSAFKLALGASSLPLVPYAVAWSANVVNPLLMLIGLRSRRTVLFVSGAAIELLVYNTTAFKSALFAIVLVIPLLVLLAPRRRHVFGSRIALSAAALIPVSLTWDRASGSLFATDLVLHRLIMLPGQLVADYYQYFSEHVTYGLRHSIFGFLGPAPYELGPPNLIGAVYFGNPITSANANIWGDAFANFGLLGIPVFTVALGLFLVVLDRAARGRDLRVTGTLAGLMTIQLANSGLLTTMANLGLGLATLLILLMPQHIEVRVDKDGTRSAGPTPPAESPGAP
jgi:hypothetical protein